MSDAGHQSDELEPDELGVEERWVDERLSRDRPVPPAAFRGALGRYLAAQDPGLGPRPQRLWAMVAAYLATAALLILLGLLQASGAL
jgi:hypothetical protein